MYPVRIVDEDDERRRLDSDLGGIVIFYPFAAEQGRFMMPYEPLKDPVKLGSRNPLFALRDHPIYFIKYFGDALSGLG